MGMVITHQDKAQMTENVSSLQPSTSHSADKTDDCATKVPVMGINVDADGIRSRLSGLSGCSDEVAIELPVMGLGGGAGGPLFLIKTL